MIGCDPSYHDTLMRIIRELREKHPDWSGARVHSRAKITVAKMKA